MEDQCSMNDSFRNHAGKNSNFEYSQFSSSTENNLICGGTGQLGRKQGQKNYGEREKKNSDFFLRETIELKSKSVTSKFSSESTENENLDKNKSLEPRQEGQIESNKEKNYEGNMTFVFSSS